MCTSIWNLYTQDIFKIHSFRWKLTSPHQTNWISKGSCFNPSPFVNPYNNTISCPFVTFSQHVPASANNNNNQTRCARDRTNVSFYVQLRLSPFAAAFKSISPHNRLAQSICPNRLNPIRAACWWWEELSLKLSFFIDTEFYLCIVIATVLSKSGVCCPLCQRPKGDTDDGRFVYMCISCTGCRPSLDRRNGEHTHKSTDVLLNMRVFEWDCVVLCVQFRLSAAHTCFVGWLHYWNTLCRCVSVLAVSSYQQHLLQISKTPEVHGNRSDSSSFMWQRYDK